MCLPCRVWLIAPEACSSRGNKIWGHKSVILWCWQVFKYKLFQGSQTKRTPSSIFWCFPSPWSFKQITHIKVWNITFYAKNHWALFYHYTLMSNCKVVHIFWHVTVSAERWQKSKGFNLCFICNWEAPNWMLCLEFPRSRNCLLTSSLQIRSGQEMCCHRTSC